MKIIDINNYNLSYGPVEIFDNFNFSVEKGEVIGLYGHTGCGKTSLLNKIINDYIGKYKISCVFQDNKLIENLSVIKNIELPLENLFSKDIANNKAVQFLKLFNINNKAEEKAGVLSGGEKQRVNLARAFAYPCDIMLMDEAFSSQDDGQRENLIKICVKLIKERNITSVIVSHNMQELEKMCDSVVRM